jgi:putative aldouronate transport system substrate-binding protein
MKKNLKSVVVMLIAGILMTSCNSKKDAGGTTQNVDKSNTQISDADNTNSSDDSVQGKISENGRTLTVLLSDHPNQPLKNGTISQDAIFEKTGIKLDYVIVPQANYNDKKAALLSTNNMPEISFLNNDDLMQFGPEDIFLDLMPYIEHMPNFMQFWNKMPDMAKAKTDDALYGFQTVARNETANGFGPVIRTDLLKKHGLEVPKSFEELLDVLEVLKKEYPNSKPYAVRNGAKLQHFRTTAFMLGSGFGSQANPVYFDPDVDGGKFIYGPASEDFKAVLEFFNQAYERGIIDPDYVTSTVESFQANLTSGESFFFNDNSGFSLDYTRMLQKVDPEGVLEFIPYLSNAKGQRRAQAYQTALNDRFYALRSDIEDPDTVIKFMDWMYSKEGSDITNYGKEGISFEYNSSGEPEFKKEYVDQFLDKSPVHYAVFSDAGITKLSFCLYAGNTEPMFQVQKLIGEWDEMSDRYWERCNEEYTSEDGALQEPVMFPPLSVEDAERVQELLLDVNTYLEQEYDKYILGEETIDNWDQVIKKAEELGVREIEEIYNKANENFK